MRIITLIENTSPDPNLASEHGLSLYIEAAGKHILFDAGQSAAFAENAGKLGVDLAAVELAILSHGHYDHGGGLGRFLEVNSKAEIYVNQHAFTPHHHGPERYIGLDQALRESGRLALTGDETAIAPGLTLYTCNALPRPFPTDSGGLTACVGGRLLPDDFRHEQYLLLEEDGKRILFSGCAHKGVRNLVHWFCPDVFVGGFHMSKWDPEGEALTKAAAHLARTPTVFYTGHCTGQSQFDALKRSLGDRLHALNTAAVIEI